MELETTFLRSIGTCASAKKVATRPRWLIARVFGLTSFLLTHFTQTGFWATMTLRGAAVLLLLVLLTDCMLSNAFFRPTVSPSLVAKSIRPVKPSFSTSPSSSPVRKHAFYRNTAPSTILYSTESRGENLVGEDAATFSLKEQNLKVGRPQSRVVNCGMVSSVRSSFSTATHVFKHFFSRIGAFSLSS